MERFIQHEPLFIRHFTTLVWPYPVHNHNHYELVFIHSGSGFHDLNQKRASYQGPCVFLLAPEDYHIFDIKELTEFSVLKFSNVYLGGASFTQTDKEWNRLMDQLVAISAIHQSELIQSPDDLNKLLQLMQLIIAEWEASLNSVGEVMFYLIRAVFAIIKWSAISKFNAGTELSTNVLMNVMDYIHSHIHQPHELQLSKLAQVYNLSPNYLNYLFKREMGISIKRYINAHKFKLIETRLKNSRVPMKTISNEFGFTDLSHFNKFIKSNSGFSPKEIKNI